MATETADYIGELEPSRPSATEPISEGDDHLRLLKLTIRNTFPYNTQDDADNTTNTGWDQPLSYPVDVLNQMYNQLGADAQGLIVKGQTGNVDKKYMQIGEEGVVTYEQPLIPIGGILNSMLDQAQMDAIYGANVFTLCDGKDITALPVGTGTNSRLYDITAGAINLAPNYSVLGNGGNGTIGRIVTFSRDSAPANFLYCNGEAVSRTTYSDLFAEIGTTFGEGDALTTFNLPDLRGRFIRGWSDDSNLDPDRSDRTEMNVGGAIGNSIGSVQGHANKSHNHGGGNHSHTYTIGLGGGSPASAIGSTGSPSSVSTDGSGSFIANDGAGDARPDNANFAFFIQATGDPMGNNHFLRIN